MKLQKIGVLGCAQIAKRSVIPAIKELGNLYELVGVASRTAEKAEEFARAFNCDAYVGYQQLIDNEDITAVYIPLPTGLHEEWVIKSLEARKHVYVEKSIGFSLQQTRNMLAVARENNMALMEGYMFLYHSQHQQVKKMILDGEIGEIRTFRSSFGFPPLDVTNFRYNNELGGGVVFDAAGYPLRAAHFIMGNDLRVCASSLNYTDSNNSAIYGNAFLKSDTGKTAQISFGFDNYYQCNYEIWGSKGKITANKAFTPKVDELPEIILENSNGKQLIKAQSDNHFVNAFKEFFDLINDIKPKGEQYDEIELQSSSLDDIILFSKK